VAAEPEPEAEEEGLPDWLAELRPPAAAVEPEPEAEAEAEEEGPPDWLAELRPPAAAAGPEPELEAEAEEEELPDWLAELRPPVTTAEPKPELEPAPEAEAEAEEEGEEEEPPDWLAELRPSVMPVEPKPELELVPEAEEEGVPDWLAEAQVKEEGEELPDWLAELRPPEEPEHLAPEEVPTQGASMPDWLAGLRAELPAEPALPGEEALAEAELPDWLVPAAMADEEDALVRAEIPAWLLELKPRELKREEEEEPSGEELILLEPVEETGLLAGLQGTLPVEMIIAQPRAASAPKPAVATSGDTAQARLFAEIVAQPPVAESKALAQPAPQVLSRLARWILAAVLIAAVTVPLLLKEPLFARSVEPTPAVEALYKTVDSLDAGSPVLVAFDYDPTTSDEMNVIAQTIVGHLMERGARVVAVSLLPAGPATAESLLESLPAGHPYVNLGYLPGEVAAVRLLGISLETAQVRDYQGTPLADLEAMAGITTIQDFKLIVELAAAQSTLRWWIEQAGTPYAVPTGAGVSAAVGPLALPYFQTPSQQLVGLVGGVPEAATYDALRSGQEYLVGPLASRLDSQLAGHTVLVLVLLVGNVVYLVRRGTGRKD
jgi:hypothetical protein